MVCSLISSYWFCGLFYFCYHMAGSWRNTAWLSWCYVVRQGSSAIKWDWQVVGINYVYPSMFSVGNLIDADALHFDRTAGCKDLSGVWITDANIVSYLHASIICTEKYCTHTSGPNIIIIKLLLISTGSSTKQTTFEINVAPDSH